MWIIVYRGLFSGHLCMETLNSRSCACAGVPADFRKKVVAAKGRVVRYQVCVIRLFA